jgi:hypothetical protein
MKCTLPERCPVSLCLLSEDAFWGEVFLNRYFGIQNRIERDNLSGESPRQGDYCKIDNEAFLTGGRAWSFHSGRSWSNHW